MGSVTIKSTVLIATIVTAAAAASAVTVLVVRQTTVCPGVPTAIGAPVPAASDDAAREAASRAARRKSGDLSKGGARF